MVSEYLQLPPVGNAVSPTASILRYDAVLHTDLDTDVLPRFSPSPHALAAEWAVELTKLVSAANSTSGGARALDGASSYVWDGASHDSAAAAREPLRMLGYADVTTPYNGGMFLVLPPNDGGALYREGLQVLGAPWNATHGWELAGTPSHLLAHTPMVAADGAVLNRHHPAARYAADGGCCWPPYNCLLECFGLLRSSGTTTGRALTPVT